MGGHGKAMGMDNCVHDEWGCWCCLATDADGAEVQTDRKQITL